MPKNTTTITPSSPYDKWNGSEWVQDPALLKQDVIDQAEAQPQQLLKEVNAITADWRTELVLETITDEDKESLKAWMVHNKEWKALDFSELGNEEDLAAIEWPIKPL